MENFTPVSSLLGGLLIGIASAILLVFNGRLAGVSGIFSGLFLGRSGDWQWRLVFLLGLLIGGGLYQWLSGAAVALPITDSSGRLLLAGLLVGIGVTLSNGCTSGHGICGIARLSPRSVIATLVFMFSAIVTVFFFG